MSSAVVSTVRSLDIAEDVAAEFLDFLPILYPGGLKWLSRALHEVNEGTADGFAQMTDGSLTGILLGRPKSGGRYKIRTLYVSPSERRAGRGEALLRRGIEAARASGAHTVHITVASTVQDIVEPLLVRNDFELIAVERNRYGAGRDELIFLLTLD